MDSRERLELLNHFAFLYFFEQRIATQATRKWSDHGGEIKAPHDFDGLLGRVLGARIIAMSHDLVHEQPAIAREQGPVVDVHDGEQLPILRIPIVNDVETKQAQIAREFSEMAIRDKPIDSCSLQSILWKKRGLMSNRINIHLMVALKDAGEIDRLVIDQNQIDFRMRDAAGFNYVLDRGSLGQIPLDNFVTAPAL